MTWHLILIALRCLCPKCHEGPVFLGFLSVKPSCKICGLNLQDQDSGDGPAYLISLMLCFFLTPLALYTAMKYDMGVLSTTLIWGAVGLFLIVLLLRPVKSLFIMINYKFVKNS